MITETFQLVFSLNTRHSYFENGNCNCIRFKAGKATQALKKQYQFKIVNRLGGFDFYVNTRQTVAQFLSYLKQVRPNACFDFEMESLRNDFVYFTATPAKSTCNLVYDSQLLAPPSPNGNRLLLARHTDEILGPAIVGQISIQLDDLLDHRHPKNVFEIAWQAKATQWQYYVVNKSAIVLANPLIAGKSDIEFTGPAEVVLETGQNALLFTSGNKLIPLSEVPQYKFDLQHRPNSYPETSSPLSVKAKSVLKGLPCPDPSRFGQVDIQGRQEFSSPMYVYV